MIVRYTRAPALRDISGALRVIDTSHYGTGVCHTHNRMLDVTEGHIFQDYYAMPREHIGINTLCRRFRYAMLTLRRFTRRQRDTE